LQPEYFWRRPEHILEGVREMEWIGETDTGRHLLNQHASVAELLGCEVHLQAKQILIGRLTVKASKKPAQVSLIDITLVSDLRQCSEPAEMCCNMLTASFELGRRS
jgi:hypothetical protein